MSIMSVIYSHNEDKCTNNKLSRWEKKDGTGMGLRVQV
jgi:hypothetical protein